MKWIGYVILTSFLWGCASSPQTSQELELFFSPEQISLTAEQTRKINVFLDHNPYNQLTVYVGPANLDDKFKALLQSQKRIKAVNKLSQMKDIPMQLEFAPQQAADTLLIQSQ
jgi:hypothetical protein